MVDLIIGTTHVAFAGSAVRRRASAPGSGGARGAALRASNTSKGAGDLSAEGSSSSVRAGLCDAAERLPEAEGARPRVVTGKPCPSRRSRCEAPPRAPRSLPHREPPRLVYFGETFRDVSPRLRFSRRRSGAPGRREPLRNRLPLFRLTAHGSRFTATGFRLTPSRREP
jgi:hypothetical protein